MAWEHKEGRGKLFVNADKKSDKHPDRKGDYMFGGQIFQIAGWLQKDDAGNLKKDRNGNPILDFTVQLKDSAKPTKDQGMRPRSMKDELDDGDKIPF